MILSISAAHAQHAQVDADVENPDDDVPVIIVTGQKMDRSLQKTTDSVRVVTREELLRETGRDLSDTINRVANASATVGDRSFSIRGVDQRGVSGRGSTLLIFVDDSPLGNRTTALGPTDIWDLEQVEVFRGPQSTNFGRSALAGGIYIRTRDPQYKWSLDLRTEAGEASTYQAAIAGGGPIIDDSFAFRIAINRLESDGFVTNSFLGGHADPSRLTSARLKLLIEPVADISIVTSTSFTDNLRGESGVSATNGNPGVPLRAGEVMREVAYDLPGLESTETFIQSLNASWNINPAAQLRLISTYQDTVYSRQLDGDNTPSPLSFSQRTGNERIITQELRLAFAGESWAGVVGGYYYDLREARTDDFVIPFFFLVPSVPFDVRLARDSDFSIDTRNYAAFVEAEIALSDHLDFLLGLRYDYEELDTASIALTTSVAPLPPDLAFLNGFLGSESESIAASYDAWLPRIGMRWALNDNANVSFVVQRAYQAGGGVFDVIDGRVNEFGPEYLWNYELALRTLLLDGRLRFNANAYYADWSDQQVRQPRADFPFVFSIENAGASTIWGLEADLAFEPVEDWELYGAIGYAHTEFDKFPNDRFNPARPVSEFNSPDFNGNRFPFSSRWSANLGFAHEPARGMFGGVDVNFRSSQFNSSANLAVNRCCERLTANARLGYAIEGFRISLLARNLFDANYYTFLTAARPGAEFGVLGDPQTFSVRLDASF
uniref:TonB-dependent receptor n=1 Tax=Parerythrobacter lutipelagi TaxID=1964208 RepID=UPI001F009593|nr:TonB-dependent receptor [Parerythrobacter lutipelagi]